MTPGLRDLGNGRFEFRGRWADCVRAGLEVGVPQHGWVRVTPKGQGKPLYRSRAPEDIQDWSKVTDEGNPERDLGRSLVGTWFQVSRRFRHVARLPEGETGIEALTRARLATYEGQRLPAKALAHWREEVPRWAKSLGEADAGDHYMRCYAEREGNVRILSEAAFDAFRKAGGSTYR